MKRPRYSAAGPPRQRSRQLLEEAEHNRVEFPCTYEPTSTNAARKELLDGMKKLKAGHISDGDYDDIRIRTWHKRYRESH